MTAVFSSQDEADEPNSFNAALRKAASDERSRIVGIITELSGNYDPDLNDDGSQEKQAEGWRAACDAMLYCLKDDQSWVGFGPVRAKTAK